MPVPVRFVFLGLYKPDRMVYNKYRKQNKPRNGGLASSRLR